MFADHDEPMGDGGELRRRAEQRWREQSARAPDVPPEEALRLLHELDVHRIELEMQNDDLRRVRDELEVARAKYFDLFDLAPVGYLTLDAQGLIQEANLTAANLLGQNRSQLLQQPVTSFICHEDQDAYYLYRRRLGGSQGPQICELRIVQGGYGPAAGSQAEAVQHGVLVEVRLQATMAVDAGGSPTVRLALSAVTEQERAQERIAYLANLLENVNDAILAYDTDLRITAWNHRAEDLYGWNAAEVMGAYAPDVVGSQVSDDERAAILRAIRETGRWQGEVRHARRDGTPITVEMTGVALRDDAGRIFAHVNVNRDITQRKRMEEELRTSRDRLQGLSQRLVELQENERYEVANELYNDEGQRLVALLLALGRLRGKHTDPAGVALLAEVMELAEGVLSDVHNLAVSLRPATLDHLGLAAALQQTVEEFEKKAGLKAYCQLTVLDGLRLPPHVETNIYRIVQEVLTNILRHAGAKTLSVTAARRDDRLVLVLEDDGVGFDLNAVPQGAGLGLIGMRERAGVMGAKLTLESVPGEGTTVYIEIPLTGEP